MDYLARSCYMLQQGRFVADILLYYGEDTNVVAEYWQGLPDVPDGYSYDFCSPHALLNRIGVNDGCAVTDTGMSYKVVVLGGHTQVMSIEVLRKLHQLVCGGVFLIGKEPLKPAGLCGDAAEFERLVADIWHSGRSNVCTGTITEGMILSGIAPDFQTSVPGVRFVHRSDGARHIYWVRNFSGKEVEASVALRDARGPIEVLDPVTGKLVPEALRGGKLHLGADDALFLVADGEAGADADAGSGAISAAPAVLHSAGEVSIKGPWTVSFEGLDAPEGVRKLKTLASLTDSDEPAVKYFSGTATYRNTFALCRKNLPAALSVDLGEVGQMADVFINGEHVAFLWKAPYKVVYSGPLKPGKNTIEVKVVNVWVNRLIGDTQPGAAGHTYTVVPFFKPDSPLLPSGLIGPIRLELLR